MKKTITRLKKVQGQINGLIKMMENEEPCDKIIIQFQASQAALSSAFGQALNDNLKECLSGDHPPEYMEKILQLITKK